MNSIRNLIADMRALGLDPSLASALAGIGATLTCCVTLVLLALAWGLA